MKSILNKKNNKVLLISLLVIFIFCLTLFSFTRSQEIEKLVEPKEVEQGSLMTYYLEITYDGIDKKGLSSSITSEADIKSGYIEVSDPLPAGLLFNGFEETIDGTIGASYPNGGVCIGSVVDDSGNNYTYTTGYDEEGNEAQVKTTYHGLHYDEETRTVNFKVKDLKAGCRLTVGIKTRTPFLEGNNYRLDFRNKASAKEGNENAISNEVWTWIEKQRTPEYNVTYQIDGLEEDEELKTKLISFLESIKDSVTYPVGQDVRVLEAPKIEGYEFSGWEVTTENTTIINNEFKMPESDVELRGSYRKIEIKKYPVIYEIEGEKPENYKEPATKEYVKDKIITIDETLKIGDKIEGYKFLGWNIETEDIEMVKEYEGGEEILSKTAFIMPEKEVKLKGRFERIKYKIEFKFIGDVLPNNSESLLPPSKEIYPKAEIDLNEIGKVEDVIGYHFIGWNYDYKFEVPEEVEGGVIVIEGEWMIRESSFAPEITKIIENKKSYYKIGDEIYYKITVTNKETYPIFNVKVTENLKGVEFLESEDNKYHYYIPNIKNVVEIDQMLPNEKVEIKARYKVTENGNGIIKNEVEITGAEVGEDRPNTYLDVDANLKASTEAFTQSKIKICKNIDEKTNNNIFNFKIKGQNEGNDLDISMNIKNDGEKTCQTIHLDPGTYNISEVLTQEYSLQDIEISNNLENSDIRNGKQVNIKLGESYEITFNNKYRGKGFFRTFGSIINKIRAKEKD